MCYGAHWDPEDKNLSELCLSLKIEVSLEGEMQFP